VLHLVRIQLDDRGKITFRGITDAHIFHAEIYPDLCMKMEGYV
jgi:hypothetical protein